MSMWTAIALICIAGIAGGAYRRRQEARDDPETVSRLEALEQKLDRLDADLRDRVETLERIVTDRREDLKRQFDSLDKVS